MDIQNIVIDQMMKHGSVRHFKESPVSDDIIQRILLAGQHAATASNLQMISVIVVRNTETRKCLASLCGDQEHIVQAPVFMAFCADRNRLDRVCVARGFQQAVEFVDSFLTAAVDVSIAMQNTVLAAESLGLGTCYIGGIRNNVKEIVELLELPRLVFPISGLVLGFPAKPMTPKPRLDLESMVCYEKYSSCSAEILEKYDRQMADTGLYHGREEDTSRSKKAPIANTSAEFASSSVYGWMEHSARRISRPARPDLRERLQEQGFTLE